MKYGFGANYILLTYFDRVVLSFGKLLAIFSPRHNPDDYDFGDTVIYWNGRLVLYLD
jgi:hypothetical protein